MSCSFHFIKICVRKVAGVKPDVMCVTCRLGLHVSGKLATDTVVVGANVVKTPASKLLGTVELSTYEIIICNFSIYKLFLYIFAHALFFQISPAALDANTSSFQLNLN